MQNIYTENIGNMDLTELELPMRILLVTGGKSYINSGASALLSEKLKGKDICHYTGFNTNPRIEDVGKGIKLLKKSGAETILAVGGGSAIDMAKLIKGLSFQDSGPDVYIRGEKKLKENRNIKLIAIPTTSGSGSESTHFAVVYIDKKKYSLAHRSLLPDSVILDYKLTESMSPYQTACSGLDALSQGVESFWSVNADTESVRYSEKAIKLVMENLVNAVNSPTPENRAAMQKAANLAGKAINLTKTTAPHAFCYYLTSHFDIPHGYAAALLLGKFIVFNSRVTEKDLSDKTSSVGSVQDKIQRICRLLGTESTGDADYRISRILNDCGLESDLTKLIDLNEHFENIYKSVNIERLKNNPRLVDDKEELLSVLTMRPEGN